MNLWNGSNKQARAWLFLVVTLFGCAVETLPLPLTSDPNSEAIRLADMQKLVDKTDSSKGHQAAASALIHNQNIHVDGYFAAFLVDSLRASYFDAEGEGLVSQLVSPSSSHYFQARWDIIDHKKQSRLSLKPDKDAFTATLIDGTARDDGSTSLGPPHQAVAYFYVGENLPAGDYTLVLSVHANDQTDAPELARFQRTVTLVPPFQFSDELKLTARGGALNGFTDIKGHPLMEQLEAKSLTVSAQSPRKAEVVLYLRQQATQKSNRVYYYDFTFMHNESYTIKQFLKPTADDPSDDSQTAHITLVEDTRSYTLTGSAKNPADDAFPLDVTNYAATFTTSMLSSGIPVSKRGRVKLVVQDDSGQQGELTVYLSARDYP